MRVLVGVKGFGEVVMDGKRITNRTQRRCIQKKMTDEELEAYLAALYARGYEDAKTDISNSVLIEKTECGDDDIEVKIDMTDVVKYICEKLDCSERVDEIVIFCEKKFG